MLDKIDEMIPVPSEENDFYPPTSETAELIDVFNDIDVITPRSLLPEFPVTYRISSEFSEPTPENLAIIYAFEDVCCFNMTKGYAEIGAAVRSKLLDPKSELPKRLSAVAEDAASSILLKFDYDAASWVNRNLNEKWRDPYGMRAADAVELIYEMAKYRYDRFFDCHDPEKFRGFNHTNLGVIEWEEG